MKLYFVLALAFMLVQVATSTSTSTDGSTTTTEVSTTTTDASTTSADTTSTVTATETTTVTAETTSTVALSTTSDSGTDASTTTSSGDSTTAPTSDVPTGDSSTAASTSDATGGGSTEASTTGATGDSTTVAATSDATTEDSSTDASTSGATDSSSTPDSSSDATSGETATTAAEETPATATGSTDNFASTDTEATSSLPSDATTDGSSPASNTAEVTSEATSGDSTTESYTTVDGQTTDSSTDAPVSQGSTTPDGEDEETTPTPSGANYGPWSGYGNYSSDCGTAYRTRTRDCVDENDDKVDISLCEALGESIEFESVELSPCDCQVHPCLDINGNHTDELCNPSSDTSHTCFEDYDAETLTCLLQCQCEQGFENVQDGAACSDIDECSISGTQCYKENSLEPRDNVDECINTRGSYECTCQEGYKNPAYSDKDCVDINECADADVCGDPARIHCENTPGSYKCVCAEGFISVDGECIFDRFILKNYEDDYDEVINAGDSDIFTEVFYIPDGGYLSSDDQHSVINSIYATKSGLIIFHSSDDEEIDQAAFPQPKRNLNDWSKALEYVDDGIVKVAAVYWADGIFAADGAMYTKLVDLTREGNQTAYTAILPNATWAYVVTWKKITPNQKPVDPTQVNTFQAVVVGDGVKRTIRVKMTYQDSGMTWNLPLAALTEAFDYPARIGTFFNSKEEPIYEQYPFSRLYRANYTSEVVKISRVDQYTKLGNMGSIKSAGQFVYTITSQSANYIAPSTQCSSWINLERNKGQTRVLSIVSGLCASAFAQIQPFILASFRQVSGSTPGYTCYEAARPLLGQYTPRCCYDEEGGLLPASKDDVASVNGLSTVVGNVFTAQMDDQAYSTCCDLELNENGLVPEWMCDDFFELKPACTSDFFIARAVSQVRGDPHITTLDGLTYTFNGHGEYTLIKSSDFELQGRTAPVGTPAGATVFTGFAGSLNGSTKAQISLNETGNGIELWINGSLQSYNWSSSRQYGNVRVFKNDAQYTMAFDNDVNVQISPMFDLQMMVVSIIMPPDLQNKVRGLMGNYNGNSSDDLFAVNGTSISENSTEDAIFPIGKTWEATAGTTLFSYGSGLSFSDYSDPDFVPVFFNPDLTVMFTNATERATAINLCNPSGGGVDNNPELRKECYFDFAVTKNADAAAATVNAANKLASEKASLANFAPKINMNGTVLRVVAGRSYYGVLQIIATDSNEGDVLTYNMTRGPVEVTVDQRTGNVSWERVAFNPNGSLEFTVSDGKAVALFRPKVALCYCKNNGSCLFNASMPNNWNVVPCRCAPGWTGQICDQDIDGCAQNPCFTNCRDVPASQVARLGEFQCDPCPAGLSGDGRTCFDVNECLQKPSPCAQDCTNTAGSYSCSCRPGYAIGGDGRSCVDIDECRLRTDNCDAHAACINTAGGFNCTCNTGYAGKGTVGECTNIDECAKKTFTCPNNSICVDTPGSYECRCLFGYKLQEGKCINIDECALGNECSQICKDGIGSYTCQCRDFFVLNATDKTSCSPNVTCTAAEVLQCDGGNARSTCGKDSSGNVICICPQGYTLNPQNICQDNDECKAENLCSSSTSTCVNREPGYYCQCKPGFTKSSDGVTCEDIDECETRMNNCSKICANTAGGYVCRCPEGYTLEQDGFTCKDNNECASALTNDCDRLNGNCNNTLLNDVTPFGYVCGCKPGYQLTADRVTCIDLNECQQENKGGCSQGCSNTQGSFSCFCAAGYELGSDGKTCTDVNECASEITNNCFDNTYCSNNVGGYTCSCPVGFRLMSDGFTCVSILKCAEDNQCAHSCSRFNGTDVCTCPLGQALNPADNITCIDLDECALGLHVCNSSFNVVCTNQDPGYVCDCASTYFKQVEPAKCIDIDECAEGRATCDLASSYCSNKLNGYDCICNEGYQKSEGSCVDINECFGENLCNTNTSTCKNEPGSYSCECKAGYEGAGLTCNDVNECAGSNKCDADYGICLNTVGSYICGCSQGYTLTSTQRCADINECDNEALYNITCEDACINTPGSWKCGCQTGFVLDVDGRSCVPMKACNENNTCDHDCYASNGVDICVCYLGYQLQADNTSCVDIDECATGANDCDKANGKCTNTDGSYTCSCINQYTLSPTRACKDRDGDFGDWSAWGSCTPACGNTMTQSRSRNCDNPSRQGLGKDCEGELNETQACPSVLCEAAKTNGVEMTLSGLSKDDFDKITTEFQVGITKGMNEHCTSNTSVAEECCANPAITILSTIGKTFIESDELSVYSFSVTGSATSVRLVLVAEIDPANTLCNAPFTRKRRAVSFVPRSVLLGILSNPTVAAKITTTVKQSALSVLGKTITVTASAPSLPAELQTTPAPAVTTTQQQVVVQPSVQAWVIAVAVVGSLLAVAVVVIIVVVILKRPRKVAASDHAIRSP